MRCPYLLVCLLLLSSCAQSYALRFPVRAFGTLPGQKVVIVSSRGRTEIRSVPGSRDISVGGTVRVMAPSLASADALAQSVQIRGSPGAVPLPMGGPVPAAAVTAPAGGPVPAVARLPGGGAPRSDGPPLELQVLGIPVESTTRFEAEYRVPDDVRLEIRDGPEDLYLEGLSGGVTIHDGAGDIVLERMGGPVEIEDLDGDIFIFRGKGPVRIRDRRGSIHIDELTGDIDISDREDDILVQSVTGDLKLAKLERGNLRVNNIDGEVVFREWKSSSKPVINTIWSHSRRNAPAEGGEAPPAPPAPGAPLKVAAGKTDEGAKAAPDPGSGEPAAPSPASTRREAAPPEDAR